MDIPRPDRPLLTYGLYPLVVGGAATAAALVVRAGVDRPAALPAILVSTIAVCMLVEWRHPLQRRWRMTARTLGRRDLPYIGAGLVTERASEVAVAAITRRTVATGGFGPLARLPLALQVVVAIAVFDLLWYAYHRAAHATPRLWRVHGAHHAPAQLYVLMHGVFHPFDELVVRFALALVVFRFSGVAPGAVTIALAVVGAIGIISHINADVRLWGVNHLLVGPETHRLHHGADRRANYGTATTIWDQLFGTFEFSFEPPDALGLADPAGYPNPEHFHRVLLWPLRRSHPRPAGERGAVT